GTSPEDVVPVTGAVPSPDTAATPDKRASIERSLQYMGLAAGQPITEAKIDEGRQVADGVRAMVVPGSGLVRAQAEEEGLDAVFKAAGFEWREPGCSM